jgi:hypothetical protein
MRDYNYYLIGENNGYGQPQMPGKDATPNGQIKMAINTSTQAVQDNIKYKDCSYLGLTHAEVDDTYIIQYGKERLKVLYVNPAGRLKQVFMKNI